MKWLDVALTNATYLLPWMKKELLSLIAFVLLSTACEKNKQEIPADEIKHDVNFTVSDVNIRTTTFKNEQNKISGDSLYKYARYLGYNVYDQSGQLVDYQRQDKNTVVNFGKISSKLPNGTYNAVFFASEGAFNMSTTGNPNPQYLTIPDSVNLNDGFYKKVSLVVNNTDVNQTVELERFVAGITLKLTDQIPSNITKITIRVEKELSRYNMLDDTRSGVINRLISFNVLPADRVGTNKTFSNYIWNVSYPVKVIIRAYDNSTLFRETAVSNVVFQRNKMTTLTGTLFNIENTPGVINTFDVSVSPAWGPPAPPVGF